MFETVASILIGSAITWLVTWYYYKRAGDDLKAKSDELRRTNEMVLRWLETEGKNIKIIRNKDDRPVGLARSASVTDSLSASCTIQGGELKSAIDEPHT